MLPSCSTLQPPGQESWEPCGWVGDLTPPRTGRHRSGALVPTAHDTEFVPKLGRRAQACCEFKPLMPPTGWLVFEMIASPLVVSSPQTLLPVLKFFALMKKRPKPCLWWGTPHGGEGVQQICPPAPPLGGPCFPLGGPYLFKENPWSGPHFVTRLPKVCRSYSPPHFGLVFL